MANLPFLKYTSYGNNFVIVDETRDSRLAEMKKSKFAFQATSTHFGIGCDNLLFVQPCTDAVLAEINRERDYWKEAPSANGVDFIFRMFEPNGDEAFSCGNGLISVCDFLHRRYGVRESRIMTEIPFKDPSVIELGYNPGRQESKVNLGRPRRVPEDVASLMIRKQQTENIDLIENIEIRFRAQDLKAYTDSTSLTMTAHMVFTGEPHLVVFPDDSFSDEELASSFFLGPRPVAASAMARRRVSLGTFLLRRIGMFLNDQFRGYFPAGINICLAKRTPDQNTIEYRCFERGIYRETLACGTGAVAVAVVAKHLEMTDSDVITILPHLCRWHDTEAVMGVTIEQNGDWSLKGSPHILIEGNFVLPDSAGNEQSAPDVGTDTMDMLELENQLLSSYAAGQKG